MNEADLRRLSSEVVSRRERLSKNYTEILRTAKPASQHAESDRFTKIETNIVGPAPFHTLEGIHIDTRTEGLTLAYYVSENPKIEGCALKVSGKELKPGTIAALQGIVGVNAEDVDRMIKGRLTEAGIL